MQLAPTTAPGSTGPTTTAASPAPSSASDSPGFFDVAGRVRQAVNDWFRQVVASGLGPALDLLGRTVLATPAAAVDGRVGELWAVSAGIANTIVVLLVLAGGAVVMGHETVQTRYSAKEIAPRVVVGMIVANTSLAVVSAAVGAANALSAALVGQGADPANATAVMKRLTLAPIDAGGIFVVLLGLVAAVLAVIVLVTYVIRVAVLVMLVAGGPLCLIGHVLPHTDGLARLWWRALAACVGVQVAQALVLVSAIRVFFASDGPATLGLGSGDLINVIVTVCLLWLLARIPAYAAKAAFGGRGAQAADTIKREVILRAAKAAA